MLFNSIEFILFLPIVLILYWWIFNRSIISRNIFLLISSYFFYGWWDYRFLLLIILSSATDFICGLKMEQSSSKNSKKVFLIISLIVNLGILGFFKYYGFFATELTELFSNLGYLADIKTLNIVLPVGISFYTFQTLSYTIDIYRGRIKPGKDIIAFFAFVSFFPQLVAGPIERASHLLPQFNSLKRFNYRQASDGFRRILWGLFAKIVVADSVSPIVNQIFSNYSELNAGILLLGAILFAIQIYGDFAGYSNIAIGTASLMGFDLMTNFNIPYFSRSIREFWSRWHISLSTWFRDYVYIPLGGNRCGKFRHMINILITFLLSGLWHGANWTFLVWGGIHGLLYLITEPFSSKKPKPISFNQLPSITLTFLLVSLALVFFRSATINQAIHFIRHIFSLEKGQLLMMQLTDAKTLLPAIFFSAVLFAAEWINREKQHGLDIESSPVWVRTFSYYSILFCILFTFNSEQIFIYFQF